MEWLNRLRLWQKLALLIAALAVPTAVLGALYLTRANAQVGLARDELQGARYVQAVGAVLAGISDHRGRVFALLTGDETRRDDVVASEAALQKRVAELDRIDAEVGARFGVTADWHAIHTDWDRVRGSGVTSADEAVRLHNALLANLQQLAASVTQRSRLGVDPAPATAMLIRVATQEVPAALIATGDVRWYATRAAIKGYLGGDDRLALQLYHAEAVERFERAARELKRSGAVARAEVQPALQSTQDAFDQAYAVIRQRILDSQKMEITTPEVYAATRDVTRSLQQLSDLSYAAMNAAVRERLGEVAWWRNVTTVTALVIFGFALWLSWVITHSIARRLSQAVAVFEAISGGKYDNSIDTRGSDDAGLVLRALAEMQEKLRRQIETERTQAAENARIRKALDSVSAGVMLADTRHDIVYLNPAMDSMLRSAEQDLRGLLPRFAAQEVRGCSLDLFHRRPAEVRRMIEELRGTHRTEITAGSHTFALSLSPVLSGAGERLGTVVEWSDRTQEVAVEKEMQAMLAAVLDGDLTHRLDLSGKSGFFEALSRSVNQLADNMAELVARVTRVAGAVRRGADEITSGNADLAQRTEAQSSSLEETASSMEQMTTTVKQNADNAAQASQLAIAARDQAERGGIVVNQAVKAMTDINESSRRIADIIGVIDEIAFQTNLLALNAAVEAARAGEQGRGFAVVASEVRSLAGRSATAAKEIKELIQDSVQKVGEGSVLVTRSGQTLGQIVASVKKVADIVAEIAAASREQSSGIEQVNRAVMQMDELTQQNAALVEQANAASQAMSEQVRGLNEMLARYRLAEEAQAQAHAQASAAAPTEAAASAPASPVGIERRGPGRPWSRRAAPSTEPAPARTGARRAVGEADPGDSEWQEF